MEGHLIRVCLLLSLLACLLQAQPTPDLTPTRPLTSPTFAAFTLTTKHTGGDLQADGKATSGVDDDTTHWEVVGACGATCVEKILQWPPSDDLCLQDLDCLTCWQLCELLYTDELKWRSMCTEPTCTIGCMTACKFSFNTVLLPDIMPWEFLTTPTTVGVSDSILDVLWEVPVPHPKQKPASRGFPYLVYTLLFKDDSTQHWSKVTATLDHTTQVDGPHASFPGLHFLLIASSPTSTVARAVPPYPAVSPTTLTLSTTSTSRPPPIHPSIHVTTTVERKLEAEVSWFQQTLLEPEVRHPRWVVTWRRMTCNVDPSSVHCPLVEEEMTAHINSKDTGDMRVLLKDLTFNSQYIISLYLEGSSVIATQSAFYTPVCTHMDATFMTCRTQSKPPMASRATTRKQRPTTARTMTATRPNIGPPGKERISQQDQPTRSALTPQVLLMSLAVSLGSVVMLLISLCVYRRWCRRAQELDMAKVMQSYSQFPLLNGYDASLNGSRSSLQLHKIAAQSLMNGSALSQFATPLSHCQTPPSQYHTPPTHVQTTSPDVQHLVQLLQMQTSAQQGWNSMDGLMIGNPGGSQQSLWPGVAIYTPSPAATPSTTLAMDVSRDQQEMPSIITPDQHEEPNTPRTGCHVAQINGHGARSVEGILDDHSDKKHSLHIPLWTDQSRRTSTRQSCASDTDLTSSYQRQARRQIDFTADCSSQLPLPKPGVGRRASMSDMYLPLTMLLEDEDECELSGDGASRADGVLEWE